MRIFKRLFQSTSKAMGVTKTVIRAGDGVHFPKKGDTVTMHYHGTFLDGKKVNFD